MKTWKIITIVTLTILAAVLVTGTVYAYTGGGMMGNFGNHGAPTGTAGNYGYYGGGMMGGGGMMSGYGYYPQTTVPAQPNLSLIHISEPTKLGMISYAVFC